MNRFFRRRNLAILALACLTAVLANPLPAHADVDQVTGGGFAAKANILGLLIPATPGGDPSGVNFSATEPDDGFNENVPGVNVGVPNVLLVNALNVNSVAQGVAGENHAGSVTTTSSVANVSVGTTPVVALSADAISSTCTSNGDGSTGSTSVVNLRSPGTGSLIPGAPITQVFSGGPVQIDVPGIATIIINEQFPTDTVGTTSMIVNAVHITLLNGAGEIILGQSRCAAAGPDVNVPTGSVAVVKDAPDDAQGTTFTFTITCVGPTGDPVTGSPFTVEATGDDTSDPVTGLTPGTVCTASETPLAGFVNQPNQTFPAVVAGVTQMVTFVNTRSDTGGQTGSLQISKQAPADAQNVVFTFSISCQGILPAPIATRQITGSGTSTPVTGVPAGTVCTATESPTAGFFDQPAQTFPAVVANTTQTVTFFNQRTGVTTGAVAVIKQAPADAQNVTFTFTITCPGVTGSPFTRTVTGSAASTAVGGLPVGTVCTVSESPTSGFVDQPSQTFPAATTGTTQTRTFVNTRTDGITPPPDTPPFFRPPSLFVQRPTNIFIFQQQQQPASDGGIIVNNNNSSSSSSSAAAAAGGGTTAAAPPGSPVTPPQTLVRTGMDSLALGALALFLLMAGFVMLSASPAYAGGYRASRSRRRRRRR